MFLLSWILAKVTGEAVKTGGEIARTAVEVPKAIAEMEKARLEVAKLKEDRALGERLIHPATFEDVKEFDPTYRRIRMKTADSAYLPSPPTRRASAVTSIWINVVLLLLFVFPFLFWVFYRILVWIFPRPW